MTAGATRGQPAHLLFFPLAAVYAMCALPASVLAMQTGVPWLAGLATPAGHGHEMLFGFALAVAAGFLISRIQRRPLYALGALWLLARLSYLAQPGGLVAAVFNAGFAASVAALAAPQFIRAAKKFRNKVFGPVLIALAVTVAAFHLVSTGARWQSVLLHEGVLLFALLMFFMGGRLIAPAAAGHLQRIGITLEARVQPFVEGVTLLLLIAAVVLLPFESLGPAAALVIVGAGLMSAVRVLRWRLWRCRGRPDLAGLGLGYGWLAVGLVLMGLSRVADTLPFTAALHAVTIGAIGTLTISVMARTRLLWAKQDPARARGIPVAVGLIGVAALLRITAAAGARDPWQVYWLAAAAWALAYLLLLRLLIVTKKPAA